MKSKEQDSVNMLAMKVVAKKLEVANFLADERVQAKILSVGQFFARKYGRSNTYGDGREIAQEINCRLTEHFSFRGDNGCSFETFIGRMAKNLCIDDHRKSETRNEALLDEQELQAFPTFSNRLELETEISWYYERSPGDEEVIGLWIRSKIDIDEKLTLEEMADKVGLCRKTVARKIDKFIEAMQLRLGPPPSSQESNRALSAAAPR